MRPVLHLPGHRRERRDEDATRARAAKRQGRIEVDIRNWKPKAKAAIADDEVDERAARRALDVDGWQKRRRGGGA